MEVKGNALIHETDKDMTEEDKQTKQRTHLLYQSRTRWQRPENSKEKRKECIGHPA
jgi:hypothetical protein